MKHQVMFVLVLICLISFGAANAQNTLEDVHLFQSFYRDAPITTIMYGEGAFEWASYDYGSSIFIGAQGGYPVNPQVEVNAKIGFMSFSPDQGDGQSGLSDLTIAGRYNLSPDKTKISAGGFITLPIGEEKAGQSKLNFGAFGALRHPLDNGMVITGTAGLDFLETTKYEWEGDYLTGELKESTEYETSFVLGGGVIYPQSDQLNIVGELMLKTEVDYIMLSGGVDYKLQSGNKVRGALGIGFDDGAPDIQISASFLHPF